MVHVPSIAVILQRHRASEGTDNATVISTESSGSSGTIKTHLMNVANPRPVDRNLLQPMFKQVRANSSAKLESLWRDCCIVEDVEAAPEAPLKVNWTKLTSIWGSHCMLFTKNGRVRGTCPMNCQTGHCPHKYAVEEMLGLQVHVGEQMLVAPEGAELLRCAAADAGSSADEGPPLRNPKSSVRRRSGGKVARNPATSSGSYKREAGAQQDLLSAKRQKKSR